MKYIKTYAIMLIIALFICMTLDMLQNPDKYITTKGNRNAQTENINEIEK